jgi:hypothetical protein
MTNYNFGEISHVKEGDEFLDRKALTAAGIHKPKQVKELFVG